MKKRGRKVLLLLGALAVTAGGASYAVAQPNDGPGNPGKENHAKAELNGYQENPSVSSTGFGTFDATIDDKTNTIEYVFTYAGLEGGASLFAHIHLGSRYTNGGVSVFLCGPPPAADEVCPPVAGTVTGVITPADVIGPTGQGIEPLSYVELVRAIRAGHTYANIHTTRWPGGEIRGQLNDPDQKQFEG